MLGVANASPRNYLVQRIVQRELVRLGRTYLSGRLIDIGCGAKPYAGILGEYVSEHVGTDHLDTLHGHDHIDLVGSAYAIPAPDGSFDCAICTAVLEHLEEPEQALRECLRLLKPGGTAVYTVPFIWHVHEAPRDFFRFSRYGIEHLFRKSGFDLVEIRALSGFWITFGQMFVYYLHRFNRGPLRWLRIIDGVGLAIQGIAGILDRIDRAEQWTWMYSVVARKPCS